MEDISQLPELSTYERRGPIIVGSSMAKQQLVDHRDSLSGNDYVAIRDALTKGIIRELCEYVATHKSIGIRRSLGSGLQEPVVPIVMNEIF